VAAAYDLALRGEAEVVVLADVREETARMGAARVNSLLGREVVRPQVADAGDLLQVKRLLTEADGLLSAVPYRFNLALTEAAIASGSHMVDLGGHTGIVRRQLELDGPARRAGVTVVPDCGMGPGMNITLALYAMSLLDEAEEVRIYDGGLPQRPEPPWNYSLLFHVEGLINEYDGEAFFIRDGELTPVPALSELEELELPPLGRLEAFITSGGLSTMPWSYRGKLKVLENKTLRYPGHCLMVRGLREAGLFSQEPLQVGGCELSPRALLARLWEERLPQDKEDVCLIHVRVRGKRGGDPAEARVQLVDYFDGGTGFSAMEKLTGWHAALVLGLAVRGELPAGVIPIDRALSGERFLSAATHRGWEIGCSISKSFS
jgi:lysine 6-dehydrogenase